VINRLLAILVLIPALSFAQYQFVPTDHQVYPLLQKGETLGLFSSYHLRLLPLTRTEVQSMLHQMKSNSDVLSHADRSLLDQMIGEFTDAAIGEEGRPDGEIHLLRFEERNTQVFVDARGIQEVKHSRGRVGIDDETIAETIAGGSIRARFGNHVFLGMQARMNMAFGESDLVQRFDPLQGPIQVAIGRTVFSDQATGYAAFRLDQFQLTVGRMYAGWGSGIDEQLSLSSANEPMDMLRMNFDFKRFRFSYLHASLQGIGSSRYLAGHRIDFRISDRLQVGAYETIVYAGRGIQLAYLNPFLPYHIMEHQLGDLDNNMLGVDISAIITPGLRLFGEVFVDDLSWSRSLAHYWGNKLAYHAGFHWAAPLGAKSFELLASYTRVDPWVYTHHDSANVYSHYDASIGSKIGPNADRVQILLRGRLHRDLVGEIGYRLLRRGKGNIFTNRRPEDGEEKRFLEGTIERVGAIEARVRYQFSRDLFAGINLALISRTNASLSPGASSDEKFLKLYIDLNY